MTAEPIKKSFDSPDEIRAPGKTRVEVITLGDTKVARLTLQPGWRWSECIKPIVGTDSCQARHVGTIVGGSMHVVHDEGTEMDFGPEDAYVIEPGHDAWVAGNEPVESFEFEPTTARNYAAS